VHSRFIGIYEDVVERNKKLLNSFTIPTADAKEIIEKTFSQFKPDKTKSNKNPLAIMHGCKQLDDWNDNVTDYFVTESSTQRIDLREVHDDAPELLPYLEAHLSFGNNSPGLSYNEWVGFYASTMARIITLAFNNKSKYIEACLTQSHKGKLVEDVAWAYTVGMTNRFMIEFEMKKCLFKPNWKIQYLRLFYLIASCWVHPHYFPESERVKPEQIDAMKMLRQLFDSLGIGSFRPKIAHGCLISNDHYVMAPLKLAINKDRAFANFQVRRAVLHGDNTRSYSFDFQNK
jgi:hypothetical protein